LEALLLDINQIKERVQKAYGVEVQGIEKIKNVYKLQAEDKNYCLKVVKYEFSHFWFIVSVILHLQNKGFEKIPAIILTKEGSYYISLDSSYAFLTDWVEGRECNYDNPIDIKLAALKLADFHKKSSGFQVTLDMRPRVAWFKWVKNFRTRKNEILDFKRRIMEKDIRMEFDNIYLQAIEQELISCESSIKNLIRSNYISKMNSHKRKRELCHHDFAHHNILIDKDNSINFIDFDYAILDTHLHDLSSFLIRRMKDGKWGIKNALGIIEPYNSIYEVDKNDLPIMAAFIEFPQAFWQLGIQYYWEAQPWEEEFFIKRLNKIILDKEEREDFVSEFRGFKYR
jgi:CotS family spore coat protein